MDCEGVWCGECFTPHPLDPATVAEPLDFNGEPLAVPDDAGRFMSARNGDHTLTPFQCPLCQCRNIKRRNLIADYVPDELFCSTVIRASIDAFWSRTPSTLRNHIAEIRHQLRYQRALGYNCMPPLGPWPLGSHLGMAQALTLECRSNEKGTKGRATVTHETARKARTVHTNLWSVSPWSGLDVSFASKNSKFRATKCPTQKTFFEHFSRGFRIRTGVMSRQDRAYSLEVIHEMLERFEAEWCRQQELDDVDIHWLSAVMFLLVSSFGGMRGYEVVWTDLAALLHDIERCENEEDYSGIGWPLVGRFKMEGGGVGGHVIPIAGLTKSGVNFFAWAQRFGFTLLKTGRKSGWAFARKNGDRAKASDYRAIIFGELEQIQNERPDLIDSSVDIWEDYGIQRSGRRFFDTACRLRGVSKSDIEAQCRWMKDRQARGNPVARDMVDCYTEYRLMKPALLRPSLAL